MATTGPRAVELVIYGPIERSDLPGLCQRVCAVLRASRARVAFCDVKGVEPDAVTVDALARLQLAAQRYGCRVRLCNASAELLDLVEFMGLENVLPCGRKRRVPGGHPFR
jgi:ABC-type transporter Mla MlaB component